MRIHFCLTEVEENVTLKVYCPSENFCDKEMKAEMNHAGHAVIHACKFEQNCESLSFSFEPRSAKCHLGSDDRIFFSKQIQFEKN